MTYREAKVIQHIAYGQTAKAALLKAGFTPSLAKNPQQVITAEMREALAKIQSELVANALQAGYIDAVEIHEYLTEALRADMRDIRNDDGSFKPQSEWPEIWGRMMEAGDCEVEYEAVRSHDGEDTEGRGGWETGGLVRKVKLKFASRVKLLELAMKHKGVDAMASDKHEVAITDVTYRWESPADKVIDVSPRDIKSLPAPAETPLHIDKDVQE